MQISVGTSPDLEATEALIVFVGVGNALPHNVQTLDTLLDGTISRAIESKAFNPTIGKTWETMTFGRIPAERLIVSGLGSEPVSTGSIRQAAGQAAQAAKAARVRSVTFDAPTTTLSDRDVSAALVEGVLLGSWHFLGYHQEDPEPTSLATVSIRGLNNAQEATAGVEIGRILAEAQNLTRELGWRPSSALYPEKLADEAVTRGQQFGFEVTVFDEAKLRELGMGALLGVGQGSVFGPRLVVMRYNGGHARTLALVGKGITFDSGGISLKPGAGMEEMKYDMLGAGAVLGAMCAIAQLKPSINVIGIMAIAQNMPSGSAYKPGDVVRAFNGKTIEVTNTDAEGRVALSDGVSYAVHLGADWIVEASTLTGAAVVVLGHQASCLVATNDDLAHQVLKASEDAAERVWRLPTYPEYRDLYKSDVADIKNSPGRDAGTITAGMIISEFAGTVPFAHLDIAGTAWTKPGPLNAKFGATGVMVRTFVTLAQNLA